MSYVQCRHASFFYKISTTLQCCGIFESAPAFQPTTTFSILLYVEFIYRPSLTLLSRYQSPSPFFCKFKEDTSRRHANHEVPAVKLHVQNYFRNSVLQQYCQSAQNYVGYTGNLLSLAVMTVHHAPYRKLRANTAQRTARFFNSHRATPLSIVDNRRHQSASFARSVG